MKAKQFFKTLAIILSIALAFACVYIPITAVVSTFADGEPTYYETVKQSGTACGSREPFKNIVLSSGGTNLITDSAITDSTYWSDDDHVTIDSTVGHSDSTSLKIASGADFTKTLSVSSNTEYFLSVWGMSKSSAVSLANFGIADSTGAHFTNYLPSSVSSNPTNASAWTDYITIQSQDGTWYNRIYKFYTGSYTSVKLFIENKPTDYCATPGAMYLDDISIFSVSDSEVVSTAIADVTVETTTELDCSKADNLLRNGDFSVGNYFWNTPGFTENVEVAQTDTNRMLHFVSNNSKTYYLPNIELTSNDPVAGREYTFSYWARSVAGTASAGAAHTKYGIVALNNYDSGTDAGFIGSAHYINGTDADWTQYGVTFKVYGPTNIAFAIYDDGGSCEALFDNFKLFESSNAITYASDDVHYSKPIGGQYITACESNLGTTLTSSLLASVGGTRDADGVVAATDANKSAYPKHGGWQTTYSGGKNNTMRKLDYSGVNVSKFGENLIVDPTVGAKEPKNQFVYADDFTTVRYRGQYASYYPTNKKKSPTDVSRPYALWDKPADYTTGYAAYFSGGDNTGPVEPDANNDVSNWKKTVSGSNGTSNTDFISAKHSGYVSLDPADSHTPDGSGALKVKRTSKSATVLPLVVDNSTVDNRLWAGKYYYISFWMKTDASWFEDEHKVDDTRHVVLLSAAANRDISDLNNSNIRLNFDTVYVATYLDGNDHRNVWVKYSGIYCTGTGGTSQRRNLFLRLDYNTNSTFYFDDFELYELPDAYGKACFDAHRMFDTPLDTLGSEMKVKALGTNNTYQNTNWSTYGTALYTDSTVADFGEDGYGAYYDESSVGDPENTFDWSSRTPSDWKAFWDKPVVAYHNSSAGNDLCKSPANRGLIYSAGDIADDEDLIATRTNDNTGYIKMEDDNGNGKFYIPLPSMDSFTYYTVSFWVNNTGGTGETQLFKTGIDIANVMPNSVSNLPASSSGWKRMNYVIYTGSTSYNVPSLRFDKVTEVYLDDIEVVKHTNTATASAIITAARPLGDVNNDYMIDANDLTKIVNVLIGRDEIAEAEYVYFDVNGDLLFDILDLVATKKLLANL